MLTLGHKMFVAKTSLRSLSNLLFNRNVPKMFCVYDAKIDHSAEEIFDTNFLPFLTQKGINLRGNVGTALKQYSVDN
jgi:hypothetical protein